MAGLKGWPLPTLSPETLKRLAATQVDRDKLATIQDYFLQSLSFPQMYDREYEVNRASDSTYDWLLTDGSNFLSWLDDKTEQIYWVNGKPGCGKSTLMRFVSQHNITMQRLRTWSGKRPLTTASYYFWTSGTQDQRSQAGLLRSLLHQLLTQHREYMTMTIPELWLNVWEMSTKDRIKNSIVWDLEGLLLALRMFLRQAIKTMNLVLFIDGLDEFDGEHEKIIAIFNDLVRNSAECLKLCVSSRSWPVFEDAYKTKPQFKLQDFTLPDITRFVSETLNKEHNVGVISRILPLQFSKLVSILVQKADGVFLWASLAVEYLYKTSRDLSKLDGKNQTHQTFELLRKIAEELPDELDDLFQYLVFSTGRNPVIIGKITQLLRSRKQVSEFTRDQTTAIVSLWDVVSATIHLPGGDVPRLLMDDTESDVEQTPNSVIEQGVDLLQKALENSAPGLLVHHRNPEADEEELTPEQVTAQSKVTYAHRTVKDWLDRPEIQQRLNQAICDEYQASHSDEWFPHLANLGICQASRRSPILPPRKGRSVNDIWPYVVLSLTHARMAEGEISKLSLANSSTNHDSHMLYKTNVQRYISYTASINDLLTWYWRKAPGNPDDSWTRSSFGTYEERAKMIFNNPWLGVCTRFGLTSYLQSQLGPPDTWKSRGEVPFLTHAIEFLVSRKNTIYPLSNPNMVSTLFELGFHSGTPYIAAKRNMTPWLSLLENLQQAERKVWIAESIESPERVHAWVEICNLFIKYGADLNACTAGWAKDPAIQARHLLLTLKQKYQLAELNVGV